VNGTGADADIVVAFGARLYPRVNTLLTKAGENMSRRDVILMRHARAAVAAGTAPAFSAAGDCNYVRQFLLGTPVRRYGD